MSVVLGPGISASARLDRLLDLLATEGMISSRHAAHQLGCSLETIRKDLLTLEHQGLLRRAHGGALPSMPLAEEMPITQRTSNTQEKKNIAQAALMEFVEGSTIFLESGSTTHQVASLLPENWALTVVTNSLPIATTLLAAPRVTTHLVGGAVRAVTQSTAGFWALRELGDTHVDIALLGTNAISESGVLSTPDSEEAALKAAALGIAARTIVLADHSKFRQRAVFQYGTLEDADVLITDAASQDVLESISSHQPRTIRYA